MITAHWADCWWISFDKVPSVGDSLELKGYQFTTREVDDRRILSVHVTKPKMEMM